MTPLADNLTPSHPTRATRIVAIDTSGRHGSVALAEGPSLLATQDLPAKSRHAIELMPALQDLLLHNKWLPPGSSAAAHAIDHLYLATGPGSFTGLRISIAIARALAQAAAATAHSLRIAAVPSLEIIAHNAPPEARHIVVALDAKRGQVFAARFTRDAAGQLLTADAPALVDPAAFLARASSLAGTDPVYITGEGVDYHRPALTLPNVIELDRTLWPGRAAIVHQLGWRRFSALGDGAFSDPATLLPTYIRLPEAEELWQKRQALPAVP